MKNLAPLFAILILACSVGCSSFEKKWDATGQPGRYAKASRWDGRWTSARHQNAAGKPDGGRLRCVMEPGADGQVVAHFRAYWQAFAANYEVTFLPKNPGQVVKPGAEAEFRGTHDLPKVFGGTYRYEARMARDHFRARYDSSYDSGKFEMTRQLTNAARFH